MDTIIAVIIIVVAGCYVFIKVRNQLSSKKGGGCGCGGGCSSQSTTKSCCQDGDDHCSCDK